MVVSTNAAQFLFECYGGFILGLLEYMQTIVKKE